MKRLILIGLLLSVVVISGCSLDESAMNETYKSYWFRPSEIVNESPSIDDLAVIEYEPPITDYYRIGAWNLEIFGQTKVNNVPVVKGMAEVIDDYDLIVVSEIRDSSQTAFPLFMDTYLSSYNYYVSERLGRTSAKEQIAFIWKNNVNVSQFHIYPDDFDDFEREPDMAKINIGGYEFVVVAIHIKPTDAPKELEVLASDVVDYAKEYYNSDDIVILGDLNNDCVYADGSFPSEFTSYITSDMDTTTTNTDCAYDRIYSTSNFNWNGFVDNYSDDGISSDLAEAMSDHFLVGVEWEK